MAVWYGGLTPPAITSGVVEFWLAEELLLTIQTGHMNLLPSEGMRIKYKPLEGVEEEYRVGDVTISLEEDKTDSRPGSPGGPVSPPVPPSEGSVFLRPLVKVELQLT